MSTALNVHDCDKEASTPTPAPALEINTTSRRTIVVTPTLEHDNTDSAPLSGVDAIRRVDTRRHVCGAVVEEVVVELTITGAKQLLLQEQRIVEETEGVEDVESCLLNTY